MSKYKNVFLIFLSLVLFAYAALISLYPASLTKNFDIDAFEKKASEATGLNVAFNYIDIKIKPSMETIITVRDLDIQYPDKQPLFKAKVAQLTTTPSALFFKNFDVKSLQLKNVKYEDQILPSDENKLAYLPDFFDPKPFGAKKIAIKAGPVSVKDLDVTYTICKPYSYKTDYEREATFSAETVRSFLSSANFKNIDVK